MLYFSFVEIIILMKLPKSKILLALVILCIATPAIFETYQSFQKEKKEPEYELSEGEENKEEEEEEEETGADKQLSSWFLSRAYPEPENLNKRYQDGWQTYLQSYQAANGNGAHSRTQGANWSYIGPNTQIGGRILCITIDPNNSNNLWAGSASGGLWKSTNAGTNWSFVPMSNVPVLGVSSVIIDPSNSNTIYAGTGEVYRTGNSNIGFNVWKARGTYGVGILKSTNGGTSWTQVYSKLTSDMWAVQMMEFDPNNSNIIYAAATDGLYKSVDAGVNWTLLLSKNYVSDVAINPANSNAITVAVGNMVDADKGVYYTTDGGTNWFAATGFSVSPVWSGSIRLDNSPSSNLYASVGYGSGNELYVSANFGQTWTACLNSAHCSSQYWFSHDVAVNPFTTDSLMMVGVNGYRYRVSNTTRNGIATVHADMHDVEYDAVRRGTIYIACDGGVYKTTDGGVTWTNINNGLSATQFYASIACSPTTANIFVGGLQDNNVVRYNGTSWTQYTGGDGGPCAFASGTNVIASHDARNIFRSTNGGTVYTEILENLGIAHNEDRRTGFMAPVAISKSNPSIMYVASDNLHISTDGGVTFTRSDPTAMTRAIDATYKTAVAMAVSSTNPDKVYVSTSPFSQNNDNSLNYNPPTNVLKSLNASNNASYTFTSVKNNLPNRFVMDFAISPTQDDSVFVVLGGFEDGLGSHIFVTGNGGTTWSDIGTSAVLPDVPFNAILIDPINPQVLYAGCDFGVYVSPDRGMTWIDYNYGFTGTNLVMDLQVSFDGLLVAATHGRGVATSQRFSGTLPVFFASFKGVHQSGINKLEWKTQNEVDVLRYELERSTDGISYSRIASFNAFNNSGAYTYSYDDIVSPNFSGVYFYRVRSVDIDGKSKYSSVVSLQVNSRESFKVLSNPFGENISFSVYLDAKSPVNVSIYDTKGGMVYRKQFNGERGSNTFIVEPTGKFAPGIYFLDAVIGRQRYSEKLLKQ
jgi:photosystem II stability/assembly factor-like uncharacterized protein